MKRHEREHQKSKKRADQLQKEKDSNRQELTKSNAVKDKLEKLCRELQKDNKKLKDENKRLCETEVRNREELHNRLEDMVDDMSELITHKESPETIPANMEQDELYVVSKDYRWPSTVLLTIPIAFAPSSNRSSNSTNYVKSSSTLYFASSNSRWTIIKLAPRSSVVFASRKRTSRDN